MAMLMFMLEYKKINNFIHLVTHKKDDRKKLEIEVILTSGGSIFEKQGDRGRKHLMEHCIASRTKKMNTKEFKDFQFKENILINAYTSPTKLAVTATTHSSQFKKALDVCLQMAILPTFDQSVLDQEKEVVLREISERTGDPNYKAYFETNRQAYQSGSLEAHETLGSIDDVAKTTLDDLEKLQIQNLENSHIIISLAGGGIDEDYLTKTIEELLSNNTDRIKALKQEGNKKPIDYNPFNELKKFEYCPVVTQNGHEHSELVIHLPLTIKKEYLLSLKVFEQLFLGYYAGVLYARLRDQKGYIYSMFSCFRHDTQTLELSMSCQIEHIKEIVDNIKDVFSDWENNFVEQKYNELMKVIVMQAEVANDELDRPVQSVIDRLCDYGEYIDIQDYIQAIKNTSKTQIKEIYQDIQNNLPKIQVIATSKKESIKDIRF